MKKIGIICAMKLEVPSMIPCVKKKEVSVQREGDYEIGVIVSGMGRKNALNGAFKLCQQLRPDLILVLGFCAATRKDFKIGSLLLAESVLYKRSEIDLWSMPVIKTETLLINSKISYHRGKIQTSDHLESCQENISDFVIGVDMETYAIVEIAKGYKIPIIAVRAITDYLPEKKINWYQYPFGIFKALVCMIPAKKSINHFAQEYFRH